MPQAMAAPSPHRCPATCCAAPHPLLGSLLAWGAIQRVKQSSGLGGGGLERRSAVVGPAAAAALPPGSSNERPPRLPPGSKPHQALQNAWLPPRSRVPAGHRQGAGEAAAGALAWAPPRPARARSRRSPRTASRVASAAWPTAASGGGYGSTQELSRWLQLTRVLRGLPRPQSPPPAPPPALSSDRHQPWPPPPIARAPHRPHLTPSPLAAARRHLAAMAPPRLLPAACLLLLALCLR